MTNMGGEPLEQAEHFLKSGNKQAAISVLMEFVKRNPNSARGWWMLSFALTDPKRQVECLERVLQLAPTNGKARERLNKLKGGSSPKLKVFPFKGNNGVLITSLVGVFLCGAVGVSFLFVTLLNRSQVPLQPTYTQVPVFTQSLPATWTPTVTNTPPTLEENIIQVETSLLSPQAATPDAANLQLQFGHGLQVGTNAPDFALQDVVNGKKVRLSDYLGHPVIIFFLVGDGEFQFCNYEAVEIQRIYEEYQDNGLVVLGVNLGGFSIGESGGMKQGVAYRKALGLTYPVLNDWQAKVFQLYEGDAYPINYFIDEQGVITAYYRGAMDYSMINIHLRTMLDLIPTSAP